jgi:hypothetical protein
MSVYLVGLAVPVISCHEIARKGWSEKVKKKKEKRKGRRKGEREKGRKRAKKGRRRKNRKRVEKRKSRVGSLSIVKSDSSYDWIAEV